MMQLRFSMCSIKVQFLIAALLLGDFQSISNAAPTSQIDVKSEYSSVDEIKDWASKAFFGGYETQEFSIRAFSI